MAQSLVFQPVDDPVQQANWDTLQLAVTGPLASTVASAAASTNWAFSRPATKGANGLVQLSGAATKTTAALAMPETIGTLPEGFRPAVLEVFAVPIAAGSGVTRGMLELHVTTAGLIRAMNTLGGGASNVVNIDVFLPNVTFRTD